MANMAATETKPLEIVSPENLSDRRDGFAPCTECGRQIPYENRQWRGRQFKVFLLECPCQERRRELILRERIRAILAQGGMALPGYRRMTLASWEDRDGGRVAQAVCEFTRRFGPTEPCWLYLHGPYGSGKTHIAVAVARQLLEDHDVHPTMIRWAEYCSAVQDSWDGDRRLTFHSLLNKGLLIIDDMDKRKPTQWALDQLYELVDGRMIRHKPTIITANRDLMSLRDWWTKNPACRDAAEAIISRIAGSVSKGICFAMPDYRLTGGCDG